ncbi:MAG: spore coat U domain-containing protein [Pseudomonadota bacterium]
MRTGKSFKLGAAALALASLGTAPVAVAATANASLVVSATVLATCIAAATPVVFGNYSLTALDNTGIITVTCTPDVTAYTVALDAGTGTGATTSARKLTFGTNTMTYTLFSDSGRTQNWGNVQNTDTVAASAATTTIGAVKTFTVFGRLPANQTATAGVYSDTVQVTVTY